MTAGYGQYKGAFLKQPELGCLEIYNGFGYVFMFIGCPSWGAPGKGRLTGPGGGVHQKWVQCPNPVITVHHSRWIILTHICDFSEELYFRQLRVSCFLCLEEQ